MIHRITNANVYLNGVDLAGKLEECTLPDVKHKMEDFKALGMYAETEYPVGLEKMEAKLKFNAIYDENLLTANTTTIGVITIRANVEKVTSVGRAIQVPLICNLSVMFKKIPLGGFKPGEKVDGLEYEATVYAVSQILDGKPILTVDVRNNIFMVGAVDQLLNFKLNN